MILGYHTVSNFPTLFLFKLSIHFCVHLIVTQTVSSLAVQHIGKSLSICILNQYTLVKEGKLLEKISIFNMCFFK